MSMAATTTPSRSATPTPRRTAAVVSKPGHNLQISPNLEALLQHDELTRRNSSSPTNGHRTSSATSDFPISLPLPPPRITNGGRKAGGQREQESFPTTRNKDGQRPKNAVVASDFWPDGAPSSSASGPSSGPVSPNPYLNPAPVLSTPDLDEAPTPKQADTSPPSELRSDPSRVIPETRGRTGAPDPLHRPSAALHKVEKILWIGRDSLSLFSGSANGLKRDSDRRNDRYESGDIDAAQDRQIRQVPAATSPTVTRPPSAFGDNDTATVAPFSKSATSYLHPQQQGQHSGPSFETPSYRTRVESGPTTDPGFSPLPPALLLPRLSLPSISMSHSPPQEHTSVESISSNDYLSFIDFRSPPMVDESNLCNIQDKSQEIRQRLQSISIPPSPYSIPRHSLSSTSLASMKFAPPSPTSTIHQSSPTYPTSGSSSSSVGLPSMRFAPPSPSTERIPTRLQPLSDPPSPYSPVEFAPPFGHHGAINGPLSAAPELVAERGRKLKSKKRSKSSSPYHVHDTASPLPPTINELDATERADRIRRNRKLARVFGRMPGVEEPWDSDDPHVSKKSNSPSLAALLIKQKSHRHAASVSASIKSSGVTTEPSTPWAENLWGPEGRRHSIPLAPGFALYVDDHEIPAKNPFRSRKLAESPEATSARSFIDLSDEEPRDDVSELSCFVPYQNKHRRLHHSNSTPSLVESLDSVALAEAEKRRKREKLAKLHRFLGSHVPPEAVSGSVFGPPLPPIAPAKGPDHEYWPRGSHGYHVSFDRGREGLDEREKALNVRRAQKMEKVFGTPPPQSLFHTRPSRPTAPLSQPTSPTEANPYVLHLDIPSSSSRNPNQSAYVGKTLDRRGPSDSSRCLLSATEDTPQSSPSSLALSFTDGGSLSGFRQELAQSSVYLNYQHSLNSLIDMIDRDDRQSLIELHRFLHGCGADDSSDEEEVAVNPRRISTTSLKSDRRHSLPSSASMTSLSSQFSISPEVSLFQIRRRKAAKLTNFFGVDYRELIQDILESIEKGVEEEHKQGTLQLQEVEVLMHRVRSLRKLKDPFHS